MPIIHVRSMRFETPVDIQSVVEGITEDFARDVGIALEHVSAIWENTLQGHYAVAGRAASSQPQSTPPVLVDLLAPDFNSANTVGQMLKSVVHSIAVRTGVPITNVFINYRQVQASMVFDAGEVVRW